MRCPFCAGEIWEREDAYQCRECESVFEEPDLRDIVYELDLQDYFEEDLLPVLRKLSLGTKFAYQKAIKELTKIAKEKQR